MDIKSNETNKQIINPSVQYSLNTGVKLSIGWVVVEVMEVMELVVVVLARDKAMFKRKKKDNWIGDNIERRIPKKYYFYGKMQVDNWLLLLGFVIV